MLLQARYDNMKEKLNRCKDPHIFQAIKGLEGRRAIPPMKKEDGEIATTHKEISDMIAQQLEPVPDTPMIRTTIDIEITEEELEEAIHNSPTNTAGGVDKMSYPLMRFWFRKEKEGMTRRMRCLMKMDSEDWHKAETVLIKKGDKRRYDVVKSWRMTHLLPVMAKIAERVVLGKLTRTMDLEETQYGSRKNRSTHDMFKQILEFTEYNKNMETALLTMDVEGGFDRVNIDMLCEILMYRGCQGVWIEWIRRWAMNRSVKFRFNGRISKVYHLTRGVPQGSPLSPFLFGVYVADVFRPRIKTGIGLRTMVCSYVDDGTIAVSTPNISNTKYELARIFDECDEVASKRGMKFNPDKVDWIGFGKTEWGELKIKGMERRMVEEIRILGYRIGRDRKMKSQMEYWMERGIGVKRRIASVSRRYGSEGGIDAWGCMRLMQAVYLPTIYYGIEFVARDPQLIKRMQVEMNDTLRSTFKTPLKYANRILRSETGTTPVEIEGRFVQRKMYERQRKWRYGENLPWFGCIVNDWKDDRIGEPITESNKEINCLPDVRIRIGKAIAKNEHVKEMENMGKDEMWVYTDGTKGKDTAAAAWVVVGGEGLVEEENGMRVPNHWSITKIEISAMMMAI